MTSQEAIDRIRQKLDQEDINNSFFSDEEILDEVNAARRELARLLPKNLFPRLLNQVSITLSNGMGTLPDDYLDVYPSGYTLVDSSQARMIDPVLLPNLVRNENTKPGPDNKYYFIEASTVYCFPTDVQTITFYYYTYPQDLQLSSTQNVTDLPEDVNDLAIDLAFANLNATERGNLSISQVTRASVIEKINALIQGVN